MYSSMKKIQKFSRIHQDYVEIRSNIAPRDFWTIPFGNFSRVYLGVSCESSPEIFREIAQNISPETSSKIISGISLRLPLVIFWGFFFWFSPAMLSGLLFF